MGLDARLRGHDVFLVLDLRNRHLGMSWASDPTEAMVAILMTQVAWTSLSPPAVYLDFWTAAYQTIDD